MHRHADTHRKPTTRIELTAADVVGLVPSDQDAARIVGVLVRPAGRRAPVMLVNFTSFVGSRRGETASFYNRLHRTAVAYHLRNYVIPDQPSTARD